MKNVPFRLTPSTRSKLSPVVSSTSARTAGATLRVIALELDRPTADFTEQPALSEHDFLAAVTAGYAAVSPQSELICLGEMGIGNTTAAALALTVNAEGHIRSRTTVLVTPEELDAAARTTVGFRAPGT